MRTKNVALLLAVGCSFLFLYSCLGGPTLDTTSSVSYKQTLQKIYESQKDEQARLLLSSSIISVVTDGKEWSLKDHNKAYELYDVLSVRNRAGRLMPLNGKNADKIIALGHATRKQWVVTNIPAQIKSVEQRTAELNKKKQYTDQLVKTEKAFQLENVILLPNQAVSPTNNTPLDRISSFIIKGKGKNNGTVPVYRCYITVTITDTKTNFVHHNDETVYIEFSPPIEPNAVQDFHKELRIPLWLIKPHQYELDRYTLKYSLKTVVASLDDNNLFKWDAKFSSYDEQELDSLGIQWLNLKMLMKEFSD